MAIDRVTCHPNSCANPAGMNSTENVVFNVINVFQMSKKVIYFFIYHTAATHCIISDINLKGKYRCRV